MKTQVKLLPELDGTEFIQADAVQHRFPLHFHDTFVIQYIGQGADWCCCNDLTAGQGDVFVHMPQTPHTGGSVASQELGYEAIYPTVDLLRDLTGAEVSDIPVETAMVVNNTQFVRRVKGLFSDCSRPANSRRASVRSGMKAVFESLLDSGKSETSFGTKARPILAKLRIAREHLCRHSSRDVTTAELSAVCQVSEYHLIRSFRKHFGITPRQFLISRRVAEAKRLIAGGMTVTAAAYECGFADQSHLNRHFKKVTGYSPGRLRDA